MTYDQQSEHLSGPVALLKAYSTACAEEIVSDCVNIFGGRGVTRGGLGGLAEMMHRTSKFDAILGGSEESKMPFRFSPVIDFRLTLNLSFHVSSPR